MTTSDKPDVSREAVEERALRVKPDEHALGVILSVTEARAQYATLLALLERAEAAERRVTAEMDAQGALCALLHEARTEAATLRTKLEKREQLLGEVLEEIDSPDFGGGVSEAIYTMLRRFWKGEAE